MAMQKQCFGRRGKEGSWVKKKKLRRGGCDGEKEASLIDKGTLPASDEDASTREGSTHHLERGGTGEKYGKAGRLVTVVDMRNASTRDEHPLIYFSKGKRVVKRSQKLERRLKGKKGVEKGRDTK